MGQPRTERSRECAARLYTKFGSGGVHVEAEHGAAVQERDGDAYITEKQCAVGPCSASNRSGTGPCSGV